jgi:hypothetical protein|tara:strand:+ start:1315 stop:1506 length:192 start_codon:yes stop_codon:yes gene_type:complete
METKIISFGLERETKGAVRYYELDSAGNAISIKDGADIGTLYIRKSALNGSVPMLLEVTIQEV